MSNFAMARRAAFKAGMIAMAKEMHLELTGKSYTKHLKWGAKDEVVLNRLYDEYIANL